MSDQLALMAHEGTGSGAVVSPCGRYRYRLWRRVASRHAHHMKDRSAGDAAERIRAEAERIERGGR